MSEDKKIFDIAPDEKYIDDRNRLTIFFDVLKKRFWKLISANLVFLLFNIPVIILAFVVCIISLNSLPFLAGTQEKLITHSFIYGFPLIVLFMAIPVITFGPAQAGLTYVLRCFSYEMPSFYWSDFKDKAKENLKQGLIVSAINIVIMIILLVDFILYQQLSESGASSILSFTYVLLFVVLIIFLMMGMYIYPMMVTYELSIKNLYRNAFLFSIGRFLPNLFILIAISVLILGPMIIVVYTAKTVVMAIVYIYYAALGFSLPGLILNYLINPIIDKHLKPTE